MGEKIDAYLKALEEQDLGLARELYSEAMAEAKNEPNTIVLETGKPPKLYRGKKRVALSPNGVWEPLNKKNK